MSGSENAGLKQQDLHELPPTPESHPLEDSSDAPSATSTNSRRKYQRGGRKKSTSTRKPRKSRIGPVASPEPSENEDALFQAAERELVQNEPDEPIGEVEEEHHEDPEEEYYEEEKEEEPDEPPPPKTKPAHREPVPSTQPPNAESFCPNCAAKTKERPKPQPTQQKAPSPFETGIKAFNLKRAEASGGRPFGVRAQPTSTTKKPTKSKTTTKKPKKSRKASVQSDSEEEGSVDSFEEQKQKPMSIRLDLNLMVEIFLKAKIKGDVTITFLE